MHDTLRAEVRRQAGRHKHPTAGALDSQSVKTSQIPGVRGYDAGKQIKRRKRHLLADTLGLLLAVVVTAASTSDPAGAPALAPFGRGLQATAQDLGGRHLARTVAGLGHGAL